MADGKRGADMHPETFKEIVASPTNWYDKSFRLRASARVLLERSTKHQATPTKVADHHWTIQLDPEEMAERLEMSRVAALLLGLAVETALKGRILERSPEAVEIKMTADGTGELTSIALGHLGFADDGHSLEKLAEHADVIKGSVALRNALRHFSDCVRWQSRYPVPMKTTRDAVTQFWTDSSDIELIEELLDRLYSEATCPTRREWIIPDGLDAVHLTDVRPESEKNGTEPETNA